MRTKAMFKVVNDDRDDMNKDEYKKEFGRRLFQRMLAKNWNQSDLARAAKLGRDAISTYIRGRSLPEPVSAKHLADALNCSVDDLYPRAGEPLVSERNAPLMELRQLPDDPGMAHLRIDRKIPIEIAAKIVNLLTGEKQCR